jgi:hypothetical protein
MATVYDEMGNVVYEDPADTAPVTEKVGYYEQKMIEFQNLLFQLDKSASTMQEILDADYDEQLSADAQSWLSDYDAGKWKFKAAAEGLNFAIAGWNKMGGSMHDLSIPQSLGLAPLGLPAVAAAVAAIAALTVVALRMIDNANKISTTRQYLDNIKDPATKSQVASKLAQLTAETEQSQNGSLSTIAGTVKWIALAAVAYFAFQAFTKSRK